MQPRVCISILGDVGVECRGQKVLVGRRKAIALLTYVAMSQPHRFERSMLAGLLWTDSGEIQARSSLRQTLSEIRRCFRATSIDAFDAGRAFVAIDSAAVSIDAMDLLQRLTAIQIDDASLDNLTATNRLLAGLEGIGSELDDWILQTRSAFEQRFIDALDAVAGNEDLPASKRLKAAKAICRISPLNEGACRWVMRISAEQGEIGTALQAYDELYRGLEDELDMEPSRETQELVVRIKMGEAFLAQGKSERPARRMHGPAIEKQVMTPAGPPTLAVLPPRALGPDHVPGYFLNGIVDDIVCMLASLHDLRVISSNSTIDLHGANRGQPDLAKSLNVDYSLIGTVRCARGEYHLAVQLVNTASDVVEWAHSYSASESELFDVQAHIASSIANRLVPSIQLAELRRTRGFMPEDLTAYHLTLRAKDQAFRLEQGPFDEARQLLQLAIAKDPHFAPPLLALTDWHSLTLGQGWSRDIPGNRDALVDTARRALQVTGGSGRALAVFAHNRVIYDRAFDEARTLFERALDDAPNDAETLMWSVPSLAYSGASDQAIHNGRRAIELSPQDPYLFRFEYFLGIAYYVAGQFEKTAALCLQAMERNPNYTSNLRLAGAALFEIGEVTRAREIGRCAMATDPTFSIEVYAKHHPFTDTDIGDKYVQRLHDIGLQR